MATTNWVLDPAHSEVLFKVKHMMITNVTGQFNDFSIEASTEEEDFTKAQIKFSANVNSINTKNEQRDAHLKSGDFFDAEKFPQITFIPTKVENVDSDGSYDLLGDLTIRDVTRHVKVAVEFGGVNKDPWGNTKAGFTINAKINRSDFGLSWNAVLETGGVMVSDEIRITAEIQLTKA